MLIIFLLSSFPSTISSSISQLYTVLCGDIRLLFLDTHIAVKILSPVAILTLKCPSSERLFKTPDVASFNWFSTINKPRNIKSFSAKSLGISIAWS